MPQTFENVVIAMEKTDWAAFDAVWQRVSGASPAPPSPKKRVPPSRPPNEDAARLRMLLEESVSAESAYRALIGRTSLRWLRELCAKLRQAENLRRRKLQSAYFLLTGDTLPLRESPAEQAPVLEMLRGRIFAEDASAAACHEAAQSTGSMELSRLFHELSESEAGHAELLRNAVRRLLR